MLVTSRVMGNKLDLGSKSNKSNKLDLDLIVLIPVIKSFHQSTLNVPVSQFPGFPHSEV